MHLESLLTLLLICQSVDFLHLNFTLDRCQWADVTTENSPAHCSSCIPSTWGAMLCSELFKTLKYLYNTTFCMRTMQKNCNKAAVINKKWHPSRNKSNYEVLFLDVALPKSCHLSIDTQQNRRWVYYKLLATAQVS